MSRKSLLTLTVCLSLLVMSDSIAQGQSGRRIPKQTKAPDPLPPPEAQPPIEPSTRAEPAADARIVVFGEPLTVAFSSMYTNVAVGACVDELKRSPAVRATKGKDKNRKEAIDYAKASSDTHVVLIQLESEMGSTQMNQDPRTLHVKYSLFAPATGKLVSSGIVYQGRRGPIGLPTPNTSASAEWGIRNCAQEAAGRILDALNVARPRS